MYAVFPSEGRRIFVLPDDAPLLSLRTGNNKKEIKEIFEENIFDVIYSFSVVMFCRYFYQDSLFIRGN